MSSSSPANATDTTGKTSISDGITAILRSSIGADVALAFLCIVVLYIIWRVRGYVMGKIADAARISREHAIAEGIRAMSAARSRAAPYTNPLRAGADTFDGALATPPPVPRPAVGVVDLDVVGARDAEQGAPARWHMGEWMAGATGAKPVTERRGERYAAKEEGAEGGGASGGAGEVASVRATKSITPDMRSIGLRATPPDEKLPHPSRDLRSETIGRFGPGGARGSFFDDGVAATDAVRLDLAGGSRRASDGGLNSAMRIAVAKSAVPPRAQSNASLMIRSGADSPPPNFATVAPRSFRRPF